MALELSSSIALLAHASPSGAPPKFVSTAPSASQLAALFSSCLMASRSTPSICRNWAIQSSAAPLEFIDRSTALDASSILDHSAYALGAEGEFARGHRNRPIDDATTAASGGQRQPGARAAYPPAACSHQPASSPRRSGQRLCRLDHR